MISGLPSESALAEVIEMILRSWSPAGSITLLPLKGGFSGASLYRADFRPAKEEIDSGQYIFKFDRPSPWGDIPEAEGHALVETRDRSFYSTHVPALVRSETAKNSDGQVIGYGLLYDIAGKSLDRFAPSDTRRDGGLFECAHKISKELLQAWSDKQPARDLFPREILEYFCGYRLQAAKAVELHSLVSDYCGKDTTFVVAGEVLVNPLQFLKLLDGKGMRAFPVLESLCHCDLHGGNILLHKMSPADKPYFIIDFALAKLGPVGYDHAYLELSQILNDIGDDPNLVVGTLKAIDGSHPTPLPGDALWSKELLLSIRNAINEWRDEHHSKRQDELDRQFALCRVAAGLNWANKPLSHTRRAAALCYAGWAAREYLRQHEPSIWQAIASARPPVPVKADDELWNELWEHVAGFDATGGKFVLVAEGLGLYPESRALGKLPWSTIIDLDPTSDTDGLHRYASSLLSSKRALHAFTSKIPQFDPRRATAWMMAAGWVAKNETFLDIGEWRWERLPVIRNMCQLVVKSSGSEKINVIVLPGAVLDEMDQGSRLDSTLEAIDEATRGKASIYLLGNRQASARVISLRSIPLKTSSFIRKVADTFGSEFSSTEASVPAAGGTWKKISAAALRAMQETVHVLHTSILDDVDTNGGPESKFWRGRPPTWSDLHAGLDIERGVSRTLYANLIEKLDAHRNHTIILEHSPGAGGTTVALRAAWDLRERNPVVVLHSYSPATAERVREVFQTAEQPVLLVAESSELTESAREELYRYFASHNCRVVILYVRRTLSVDNTLLIPSEMQKDEARNFRKTFGGLTSNRERHNQLEKITEVDGLSKYRLPFFYGLITFERDFIGIEDFVKRHLTHIGDAVKEIVEHLALVTIYSNSGISIPTIKAMLGISASSILSLEDLVGDNAARLLVTRGNSVRFMHQILAEQALVHLRGGDPDEWQLDLKTYSVSLIENLSRYGEADAVLALLRQMFIDRLGATDGTEDREDFAPIVETLDTIDKSLGHAVLEKLANELPDEPHFWSHLGRHQIFRLNRDFDKAEEYLTRAIELSPDDALHHHTYGLVLRTRLRQTLNREASGGDLAELFAAVQDLYMSAAAQFEEARRLSPDSVYGYITHVQMILATASKFKEVSNAKSIAQWENAPNHINAWMAENVSLAENLLREASDLYSTLEQSSQYIAECQAGINRLYGDLDAVVEIWELADAAGRSGSQGRRALANAYLARKNRSWANLNEGELRRIVNLMRENLRAAGRREEDYELWFNAYMVLPEFDANEALSELSIWSRRFPSWRAYYYSYIVNFMLWFKGRTEDTSSFEQALEDCRNSHVGRKNFSSVWLGGSGSRFGLMSHSDLGGWKKELEFFANPKPLLHVNGLIDHINGPQAGTIKIDGRVNAFFVPGKKFSAYRDENKAVHFFLGFSPSGLRAWAVESNYAPGASRVRSVFSAGKPELKVLPEVVISDAQKVKGIRDFRRDRISRFVIDFVNAKLALGVQPTVVELSARLDAIAGVRPEILAAAVPDISKFVVNLGFNVVASSDSYLITARKTKEARNDRTSTSSKHVRGKITKFDPDRKFGFISDDEEGERHFFRHENVLPAFRKHVRRNAVVKFKKGSNSEGNTASAIIVITEEVHSHEEARIKLRCDIEAYVLQNLSVSDGQMLDLATLYDRLRAKFDRDTLEEEAILSATAVAKIDGVKVFSKKGVLVAKATAPLGKLQPPKLQKSPHLTAEKLVSAQASPKIKDATQSTLPEMVKNYTFSTVKSYLSQGKNIDLASLGEALNSKFPGPVKIHRRLGHASLTKYLKTLNGIKIEVAQPNFVTIIKAKVKR